MAHSLPRRHARLMAAGGALAVAMLACGGADATAPRSTVSSVATIGFAQPAETLLTGGFRQMATTVTDASGSNVRGRLLQWSSDAPLVASVTSAGFVTALSVGTATITARGDSAAGTVSVVVSAPLLANDAASVTVYPRTLTLSPGTGGPLAVRAYASDTVGVTTRGATFASSNTAVVTVTARGTVIAVGPGNAFVTVAVGQAATRIPVSVAAATPARFTIEVRGVGSVDPLVLDAAQTAAARWERVLAAPLPSQGVSLRQGACATGAPPINAVTSGLIVIVEVKNIDGAGGTVGSGGPCMVRPNGIPIVGDIAIDAADVGDLAAASSLVNVLTHELGHVLGIGTVWGKAGTTTLGDTTTADPRYLGPNALRAALDMGFLLADSSRGVPLENRGGEGSKLSHWRESAFVTELMTSVDGPGPLTPMSVMTVEALRDIGYDVRDEGADFFSAATAVSGGVGSPPSTGARLAPVQRGESVHGPRYRLRADGSVVALRASRGPPR